MTSTHAQRLQARLVRFAKFREAVMQSFADACHARSLPYDGSVAGTMCADVRVNAAYSADAALSIIVEREKSLARRIETASDNSMVHRYTFDSGIRDSERRSVLVVIELRREAPHHCAHGSQVFARLDLERTS